MVVSDHHPISMTLAMTGKEDRSKIWRYDPTILSDVLALDEVKTALENYFTENDSPDISPLTIWEARKCVIRGVLMKLGAQRKRRSQKVTQDLILEIRNLETTHKLTKEQETFQKLLNARTQLLEEMGRKHKRRAALSQKLFYDQGNKPGRLLACAL